MLKIPYLILIGVLLGCGLSAAAVLKKNKTQSAQSQRVPSQAPENSQ